MQVFKLYFKIIRKNIAMLTIYFIIFIGVSILFISLSQVSKAATFTETKCKVAFISYDDSELINGLKEFIGSNAKIINIKDDKESLQDALFFRKVECIIKVPQGFTQRFFEGREAVIEKTSIPDSPPAIYVDMMLDGYLNTARLYLKHTPDVSEALLAERVGKDMNQKTAVEMKTFGSGVSNGYGISAFFNYASYTVTMLLIFGITSFMLVFNQTVLKQRTECSPLSQTKKSFETLLANFVYTLAVWFCTLIAGVFFIGAELFTFNGFLWAVNLLFICIVGLGISFLVGTMIKRKTAQSAVANTIGLGLAFLSGSFVPQSLLGKSVLSVSRFLPTYWYVKASDEIGSLKTLSFDAVSPIIICFLIELGFAAAIISVAVVVARQKRIGTTA